MCIDVCWCRWAVWCVCVDVGVKKALSLFSPVGLLMQGVTHLKKKKQKRKRGGAGGDGEGEEDEEEAGAGGMRDGGDGMGGGGAVGKRRRRRGDEDEEEEESDSSSDEEEEDGKKGSAAAAVAGGGAGGGKGQQPPKEKKPMSEHKRIYSYFRGLLKHWERDLNARPDEVKRMLQVRCGVCGWVFGALMKAYN